MEKVTTIKPNAQRVKPAGSQPPSPPDFSTDRLVGPGDSVQPKSKPNYFDKLGPQWMAGISAEMEAKPWAGDFKLLTRMTYMLDAISAQLLSSQCEQERFNAANAGDDDEWSSTPISPDAVMGLMAAQHFIAGEARDLVANLSLKLSD